MTEMMRLSVQKLQYICADFLCDTVESLEKPTRAGMKHYGECAPCPEPNAKAVLSLLDEMGALLQKEREIAEAVRGLAVDFTDAFEGPQLAYPQVQDVDALFRRIKDALRSVMYLETKCKQITASLEDSAGVGAFDALCCSAVGYRFFPVMDSNLGILRDIHEELSTLRDFMKSRVISMQCVYAPPEVMRDWHCSDENK